jgi:C-3',4' desaturase CrtD
MAKILVIGAGVGGATAAALLAKAGHAVTVLEAHVYAGGCAGTFFHKGYRFDAGATLAGGFHNGGPHDVVGRELGIDWDVHPAEPAWRVHLPDRAITRYGNAARWHDEVTRNFGAPYSQFLRSVEAVSDAVWSFAARKPAWPPSNARALAQTARAIRPETLRTLPHLLQTMGSWMRAARISDPAARAFMDAQLLISAQTTSAHASALFGAAAYDLPRKGVNHVRGGIGAIATKLVEAARAHGATVHFRQQVTKLEARNGRVIAAHTNKGLRVECDACIANLTPWDLAQLLGEASPTVLMREMQQRPPMWGAFTLYLGVEDDASADGVEHHQVVRDLAAPLGEGNSAFISFSMAGDATRAPIGHRAVTISTHTNTADWWHLRNTPGAQAQYQQRVCEYSERLLAAASIAIPNLRNRIVLQLPGTPVTFKFYTRRHLGGVGGFPFTSLFRARGPGTGMRNTWLVGDSIFPGQSTAGVTMGALRVVDEVMRSAE